MSCVYMQLYVYIYIFKDKEPGEGELAILPLNISIRRATLQVCPYSRGTNSTPEFESKRFLFLDKKKKYLGT